MSVAKLAGEVHVAVGSFHRSPRRRISMPDMSSSPPSGTASRKPAATQFPGVSTADADSHCESNLGTGAKRGFHFRRLRTAHRPFAVEVALNARVVIRLGEGLRGLHVR